MTDTKTAEGKFERIWLHAEPDGSWYEWTWSQEKIDETDTEYIRADLAKENAAQARREALREASELRTEAFLVATPGKDMELVDKYNEALSDYSKALEALGESDD